MHKRYQLLHKGIAGPHNVLKLINYQNLLTGNPMGNLLKNILKGRKFVHNITVMGKLPSPLVSLFPLRTCSCQIIIPRTILHKLLYERCFPDMLLAVDNQYLTAVPVIVIIQISQFRCSAQ